MILRKKKIVSFQGIEGANSHLACRYLFPTADILPCETFEEAFQSVEKNKADTALIPIENSIAGRVAEIHSIIQKTRLKIVGEYFMKVDLHLLGLKNSKMKDIKIVRSHIHAIGQCKNIINKLKLKKHISADTAGAAKEIAEKKILTESAIASELASKIYKLKILKKNVQDSRKNTTRFLFLEKKGIKITSKNKKVLTSLIFRVNNTPASLHKALSCFAINNVNMTKLESYVGESFKQAEFYIDIEGNISDTNVASALEEIKEYTEFIQILGVYYADKFRK